MPLFQHFVGGGKGCLGVQGHLWLHLKLEVNLGFLRICLNKERSMSSNVTHCTL